MSGTTKPQGSQTKSGVRIPGFAQLQRLGKSLMLPIAVMTAAGDAIFSNLPLLFAVGVAIGFAKKADGSTALAAVVGYLVVQAVFKTMSPIVLEGEVDKNGDQALI